MSTGSSQDYYSSYSYDNNGNIETLNRFDGNGNAMDSLSYNYIAGTNQLEYVDDTIGDGSFSYDIDDQDSGNYQYDAIGNLIQDLSEEIDTITWTVYGKIKSIVRTSGSSKPDLSFEYSPDGYRVAKHVTDSNDNTTTTWYVRDASGNIMATYIRTWELELDTSNLTVSDIYNELKSNTTYTSRITFFDQGLSWHNYVPSTKLDELEMELESDSREDEFLDYFSSVTYMSTEVFDSVYAHFDEDSVFNFLKDGGYSDGDLASSLCDACVDSFLIACLNYDYSGFLEELSTTNSAQFNYICDQTAAPPDPPATTQMRISHIVNNSTELNTAGIMNTYGHNCSDYETILSNIVTYNTQASEDLLLSVDDFKSCIKSDLGKSSISQAMEDYFGASVIWDSIFSIFPGTEGDHVDSIRANDTRTFLKNAMLALGNETTLDGVVASMSTTYLSQWFEAIQNIYGQEYYDDLIQTLLPGNNVSHWTYSLNEHHIYGSSRLGIKKYNKPLFEQMLPGQGSQGNYYTDNGDTLFKYSYQDSIAYLTRGATYYELSNHLGNVLVVVTDRKLQACDGENLMYYTAQVVSTSDYYPFGMVMRERSSSYEGYRYGFNGMEKDDEVGGEGNSYTAEFWQYDSRLVRRFNIDPKDNPSISVYVCFGNSPMIMTDPNGDTIRFPNSNTMFGFNFQEDLNKIYSTVVGKSMIRAIHSSEVIVHISDASRWYLDDEDDVLNSKTNGDGVDFWETRGNVSLQYAQRPDFVYSGGESF